MAVAVLDGGTMFGGTPGCGIGMLQERKKGDWFIYHVKEAMPQY